MIGASIAAFRQSHGLTHAEFGALIGAVPDMVKRWQRGDTKPHSPYLRRVESVLSGKAQDDVVFLYTQLHIGACRAVFRDLQGTATPIEKEIAEGVRRHGYPLFASMQEVA